MTVNTIAQHSRQQHLVNMLYPDHPPMKPTTWREILRHVDQTIDDVVDDLTDSLMGIKHCRPEDYLDGFQDGLDQRVCSIPSTVMHYRDFLLGFCDGQAMRRSLDKLTVKRVRLPVSGALH